MRLTGLAAVIQALFGCPAIGEYEFVDGDGQSLTPLGSAPDGLVGLMRRGALDGVNDRLIELYLNDERGWGLQIS